MDILKKIQDFKNSSKYEAMETGEKYFTSKTNILNRQFYYYPNQVRTIDPYRANNKIVDNFFRMLVEQKVSYCVSKDIVIENYNPLINVNDFIDEISEEASIKGLGWAHPYINMIQSLKIAVIPSQEIIPIYDGSIEKNLVSVIRFYDTPEGQKIEYWDNTQAIYYEVDEDKGLIEVDRQAHIWRRVPFVPLFNNRHEINDLDNIKCLIDSFDKCISDFANNFEDFQDVFYKIKNYTKTTETKEDMANVIEFLKQYHVVSVDADGDFEAIQLEVPHQARTEYLKHVRELIYLFGQGVDTDILSGGSLTNVVIKARFANLEQKGNKFIKLIKRFIEELMYFDVIYKQYTGNADTDLSKFNIVFNTTLLINENEKIDGVVKSKDIISKETNLSEHPWVNDLEGEKKRISEEKKDLVQNTTVQTILNENDKNEG